MCVWICGLGFEKIFSNEEKEGPNIAQGWACGLVLSTPDVSVIYSCGTNQSRTVVENKDSFIYLMGLGFD